MGARAISISPPMRTLLSLAAACCVAASAASASTPAELDASCTLRARGLSFDFSPLAGRLVEATDAHEPPWSYFVSACSPVAPPPADARLRACGGAASSFFQLDAKGNCARVSDAAPAANVTLELAPAGLFRTTFAVGGGAPCGVEGTPRAGEIVLECGDADADVATASEPAPCHYRAVLHTRAACPSECPRSADGRVCSGRRSGICVAHDDAGVEVAPRCACEAGFRGSSCEVGPPPAPLPMPAPALAAPSPVPRPSRLTPLAADATGLAASGGFGGVTTVVLVALVCAAACFCSLRPARARAARSLLLSFSVIALIVVVALGGAPSLPVLPSAPATQLERLPTVAAAAAVKGHGAAAAAAGCTLAPGARLAIYQFYPYHTEVAGFIIDFARLCGHNVTLFLGPEAFSGTLATSSLPVYAALYGPLATRPAAAFIEEFSAYDAGFMTTPQDSLDRGFQMRETNRLIYTVHLTVPGFVRRWQTLRLYTTALAGFPVVHFVYAVDTPPVAAATRKKTVVYVGSIGGSNNAALTEIADAAVALERAGLTLTIFTRGGALVADAAALARFHAAAPNLRVIYDATTAEIFAAARTATFFLVFPKDDSVYLSDRSTGSLSLAFSVGTPLLTKTRFAAIYDLSPEGSGTLHATDAAALGAAAADIAPSAYAQLVDAVSAFRVRLRRHNVRSIEFVLNGVPALNEEAENGFMRLAPALGLRGAPAEACALRQ